MRNNNSINRNIEFEFILANSYFLEPGACAQLSKMPLPEGRIIFGDYGTVKTFHFLPLIWQYKGIISLAIFKQNIMRQDELVTNTNYRLRLSNRHLTKTILVLATFQKANATEKSFLETSNVVIVNYNFLDPN